MARMNAQDKKWQAEDDARTLARASEISADKKRLKSASNAAASMAKVQEAEAKNMRKVAKRKVKVVKVKTPTKKRPPKKKR